MTVESFLSVLFKDRHEQANQAIAMAARVSNPQHEEVATIACCISKLDNRQIADIITALEKLTYRRGHLP